MALRVGLRLCRSSLSFLRAGALSLLGNYFLNVIELQLEGQNER